MTAEDSPDVSDKEFMAETCRRDQYDPEKEDVTWNVSKQRMAVRITRPGRSYGNYWVCQKMRGQLSVLKIILTDTEGQAHAEENGGQKQKEDTKSEEDWRRLAGDLDVEVTDPGKMQMHRQQGTGRKDEDGEVMMFSGAENTFTARETVHLEKGETIYYPVIWKLSDCWFTVNGKIAYCLESLVLHRRVEIM